MEHNRKNNITPQSIKKEIYDIIEREYLRENAILSYVADTRESSREDNMDEL